MKLSGDSREFRRMWSAAVATTIFMLSQLISCTPSPYAFTLSTTYTRDKLSGRDLGSHRIALFPLITANGTIEGPKFPSAELSGILRGVRPDLLFVDADSVKGCIARALPGAALDSIRASFFKGAIALLQTEERFWRVVPADYLLVVTLRHGVDIVTFNQVSHKRIIFEAELWDCDSMETALRQHLVGTCNRAGYSDRAFLLEAFKSIGAALPASAPAYDTKKW